MLINTNIQRIVGGGYEIKEVRYMNNVVWKKRNEFRFQISPQDKSIANIYVNRIRLLKDYPTLINTELDYVNMEVSFSSLRSASDVRIFVGEDIIIDRQIEGEFNGRGYNFWLDFRLELRVLSKKNINYIKVVIE